MTIVNDDSRIVNKLEASLTGDARVVIYNRLMFIVLATGMPKVEPHKESNDPDPNLTSPTKIRLRLVSVTGCDRPTGLQATE
jgi:hypothetical protein